MRNPDRVEKLRHSRGVARRGKRPGHHHPVVTGQHAGDPIVIALRQRPRHLALDSFGTGGRSYPLFGSGSAVAMSDGPLRRRFWRVVDALDYLMTLAWLRILDALA